MIDTEKTFFGGCPFIHDDISVLYGVPTMPREELPKICTCGKSLTYADIVWFVSMPSFENSEGVIMKKITWGSVCAKS